MTYDEALEYIHSTQKFGSRLGLERIGKLLELMSNPQVSLKFVHVAGTNGKGSVCGAVSSALKDAGYKTGLYISPFITDFCERMQTNGEFIPHEKLAEIVEKVKNCADRYAAANDDYPTEFELVTAAAFEFFAGEGCDIVVLEVGLGGRFDATNIIKAPLVSAITSISLDHTEILGDTEAKIAFEKCGIIKSGGITVTAPAQPLDALEVIMRCCAERNNTLVTPNLNAVKELSGGFGGSEITYGDAELLIPLAGKHQIINFITAYEILNLLRGRFGFKISEDNIKNGFAAVIHPARMEILNNSPLVILDGAHNPASIDTLTQSLYNYGNGRRLVVVMGMFADKDYNYCISKIASLADNFIAIEAHSSRALPAIKVADKARKHCKNVYVCLDYGEALKYAAAAAGCDGIVLICGSLYFAGEMRIKAHEIF